jgi:hypothetical protein
MLPHLPAKIVHFTIRERLPGEAPARPFPFTGGAQQVERHVGRESDFQQSILLY